MLLNENLLYESFAVLEICIQYTLGNLKLTEEKKFRVNKKLFNF